MQQVESAESASTGVDADDEPLHGREIGGGNPLEHGWWAAILAIVGLLVGSGALSDNSFLTHLATGRLIRAGDLPHADPYSFTAHGDPWVVQSWGASWWYATLEDLTGPWGIRMMIALCVGAVVTLVWRLSRPAQELLGRLTLVGLCFGISLDSWNERPQVLAAVAVASVALVVAEQRPPWLLAPIFAFWVNVHGSFPVGLLFVGAWAASEVIEHRRIVRDDVTPLGWSLVGAVGGAALSPYGLDLLWFPVDMLNQRESFRYIKEWQRPELLSPAFIALLVLAGVSVTMLVRGRRWSRAGVVVALVLVASTATRNVSTASLLLVPFAAPALSGLGSIQVGPRRPLRQRATVIAAAVAVVGILAAITPDYALDRYPQDAVTFLEERDLVANGSTRILTHDFVGNYLEWRFGDDANVWVDDRAEVMPPSAIEDYVHLLGGRSDWREIVARYDGDLIVWEIEEELVGILRDDPGYTEIYTDDDYVVMCRHAGSVRCG